MWGEVGWGGVGRGGVGDEPRTTKPTLYKQIIFLKYKQRPLAQLRHDRETDRPETSGAVQHDEGERVDKLGKLREAWRAR